MVTCIHTPAIGLRVAEFRRRAKQEGLVSDSDIAARIGLHRTTVMRLLSKQTAPGYGFIAAVLAAFPETRFEDVFEVISPIAHGRDAA